MNTPLTYPDQPRDENLIEFFLNLVGQVLKTLLRALMAWVIDLLP